MRISQLARSLGIPPSDIVEFLGNQSVDANSRLDQEIVDKVIGHFAPGRLVVTEEVSEVKDIETQTPDAVAEDQQAPDAPVEVIRVSKVELQGLKVLGKIELPAPKKKAEPTPTEEQTEQQEGIQQPKREFQKRNNNRRDRDWVNPLEQKRQQEAREEEKRRQENAAKQKEKRTNHYYNKVKSVPTKAVRRFEEQTVVEDVEVKEQPKGLFGKFLRWLRS